MNPVFRHVKTEVNYLFFRKYRYKRVVRRHLAKYYQDNLPLTTASERIVVFMADGKYLHGGLADRLRCIASIYNLCKKHGIRFAINFIKPFQLTDYLVPAQYDWTLKSGELTFNSNEAHAVYMDNTADNGPREIRFQEKTATEMLSLPYKQIHVYSSFYFADKEFGKDFAELFQPTPALKALIEQHKHQLGKGYISVSTRFLELLGDFKEPKGGLHITPEAQLQLINTCINKLKQIIREHHGIKVLVTSDSIRFLQAASQLPEVYVIDGKIAHVDTDETSDHTKTFLDFLLITGAVKAYQLRVPPMYSGNFSLRAAQAGNITHSLV